MRLVSEELVMMGAAIAIALETGKLVLPRAVLTHPAFVRTMPVTPLLCGVIGVSALEGALTASSVALGVCVGGFSGHLYKLVQQTLRGHDARLERHDDEEHGAHDGPQP